MRVTLPPVDCNYHPSPMEMAIELAGMDSDEMAVFFNALAHRMTKGRWAMQLEFVSQSSSLDDQGRWIMGLIGDYAQHNRGTTA